MLRLGLVLCVIVLLGGLRGAGQDVDLAGYEQSSVIEVMHDLEQCGTFLRLLEATDLSVRLEEEGPFTLFAPTDEAFDQLPPGTIEQLLKPENAERLMRILAYHIVPGALTAEMLGDADALQSLEGEELEPSHNRGLFINQASIVEGEIEVANGIVYLIDEVLLPPLRQVQREPN